MDRLERLLIVPITAFLIFPILQLNTRPLVTTRIMLSAVPFSLVGTFWLLHLLGYTLSVTVWVGLITLARLDAEMGVMKRIAAPMVGGIVTSVLAELVVYPPLDTSWGQRGPNRAPLLGDS